MSSQKETTPKDAAKEPEGIPEGQDIETTLDEDDSDSEDSLTFSNGVIEKIVALSMREVPGVVGMKGSWFNRVQETFGTTDTRKGVTVEVTPESAVRVNISVFIEYGAYAPQVFEDVLTPEEYDRTKRGMDAAADEPAPALDAPAAEVEPEPAVE